MALSDGEQTALSLLENRLRVDTAGWWDNRFDRRVQGFLELDAYFNGVQRLEQLGLAVPPELRRFVTLVNWPRVAVQAVEERIDLEGFRLPGQPEADDDLWRVWQANGLDEESQLAHLDALVFGRSYVTVGSGDDEDTPLITCESPLEMVHLYDPRSRSVRAAARFYTDDVPDLETGVPVRRATLYMPDATVWLSSADGGALSEDDRDEHGFGVVPVEPITNGARLSGRFGASHMLDAITLTDSAARALTNAQVATETLAVPARYALGVSKGDFVGADGQPMPVWETYFGRIFASANPDAKLGQYPGADLSNFKTIVDHYGQLLAGLYGLPTRYVGLTTANPPSADGIRADEARLVKTAERKERAWGGSWERVMRLVRRFQTGVDDPELALMETLWRDPATPTRAQAADAVVKLHAAGILPTEAAWEDLGYSAVRREKLKAQFKNQQDDPVLSSITAALAGGAGQAAAQATPGGVQPQTAAQVIQGQPVAVNGAQAAPGAPA